MKLFKRFKEITNEEEKIINIIKEKVQIANSTKILDIGGAQGVISKGLQPNTKNITLVDIDELDNRSSINFIKSTWEDAKINKKFEIIIASHVLGHFGHIKKQRFCLKKMFESRKKSGKIILCYNTNKDFLGKLIDFSKKRIQNFQYDYFNENLIEKEKKEEILFNVTVYAKNFVELAELVSVLIITGKKEYKKNFNQIKKFLEENLKKPFFTIEQKVVLI